MIDFRLPESEQEKFSVLVSYLDNPFENKGEIRKGFFRRERLKLSLSDYLRRISNNENLNELSKNLLWNLDESQPLMSYIAIPYEIIDPNQMGFYVKDYIGWYRMTEYLDEMENFTEHIHTMFSTHRSYPNPNKVEGRWESIQLADIIDLDPGQVSEMVDILNNK